VLRWGGKDDSFGIKFEYREAGRRRLVVPDSVFYLCEKCAAAIEERHKYAMSAAGVWIPQHADTATPGWAGFHLNALVSPFDRVRWPLLVQEWLDAQDHHDKLKVFINTRLGEAWRTPGTSVTASELEARAEDWRTPDGERVEVPHGVGLLTAFVDVQHDRLEVLVKGWGADEESWNLAHHRLYGDPSIPNGPVWQQLEAIRTRIWRHASGARMRISAMGVDSGYCRNEVYAYVAPRQPQAVFATKGGKTEQAEPIKHSRSKNAAGVKLVLVGTVPMKDTMFPRLRKKADKDAGPLERFPAGYIHFRTADPDWHNGMDSEYFAQFERERVEWEDVPGGGRRRTYKNPTNRANEAIDLEVGNLAVLHLLGASARENLGAWAEQASRWQPPAKGAGGAARGGGRGRRVRSQGVGA
jgi:phage terminase large subunit GpA-like protein